MRALTHSICSALVLLLAAATAQAQDAAMPQRWLVVNYHVEPGMQMQHEALARRYRAAAEKVGLETPWFTAVTAVSDRPRYVVVMPIASMAMFDGPRNLIARAEGPEALAEVMAIVRETYTGTESMMVVERPDLGIEPPDMDDPPVGYWMIQSRVRPGAAGAYQDYVRALVQASSEEQYWNMFQGVFGGANTWAASIPIHDWTDMDRPPGPGSLQRLRTEFGERRGNEIFASGTAAIEETNLELMRWRWDLSWIPQG